jgi:glycerophosphoryl diester phosphodiesterase
LAAFEIAVRLGYRYLETDVHLTRDGVLVAFHDERLDRVTDRTGAIAELGIAEVQAADAGHTFTPDGGRTFPFRGCGIRVPRLQEILARWTDARVNIDPKSDACVGRLAVLLDRLDAWERVCVGSFSDRRLSRIRALGRGRACTSMGPQAVALARLTTASALMRRLGSDCIQVPTNRGPIPIVTERFIAAAHTAGLPVHVWTINDETTINELLDLGVDGIMSDRVRLLRDVLTSRGVALTGASTQRGASTPR